MFFIISGFCIHYRQARLSKAEGRRRFDRAFRTDVADYARRRFRRIYPPFAAAVGLTLLLDLVGRNIAPEFYSGGTPYNVINLLFDKTGQDFVRELVSTLLMQGGLLTGVVGSNGALWSLSYEFWFYVLYPVLWLLAARRVRHAAVTVAVASVLSLVLLATPIGAGAFMSPAIALWGTWFAGATLAVAYAGRSRLPPSWMWPPVAAALLLTWWKFGHLFLLDYGFAAIYVFALDLLLFPRRPGWHAWISGAAATLEPLGRISYSLYLVHVPWLGLLSAIWLRTHGTLPGNPLLGAFGVLSSLALGTAGYYLVERRFLNRKANWANRRVCPVVAS